MPALAPAVALALASLAIVAVPQARAKVAAEDWPVQMRRDLDRLGQMEWRLHQAVGSGCPAMAADAGLTFDDPDAYPREAAQLLASTVGMTRGPVIAALAADGPAARAGLRVGDRVVSIGGRSSAEIVRAAPRGTLTADALADHLATLPAGQPVTFVVERDGQPLPAVAVVPARHCAARFILVTDNTVEAHSDGHDIAISTGLLRFVTSEDELALVAGHELGHVVHGDEKASGLGMRRAMEDAADLAGAQIARCAGYDVDKAADFFIRLDKHQVLGFLALPTHRNGRERARRVRLAPPGAFCRQPADPAG